MPAHPTINPGDTRTEVLRAKKLEKRHLVAMGFKKLAASITNTKTYGPQAVDGIKKIQRKYKLTVDGVIGPKTWAVLEKAAVKPPAVKPLIIRSRESWKAQPPKARTKCDWTAYTNSRLHHTVTPVPNKALKGAALLADEREKMRQLQQIAFGRGFSDISYSYIVFPSGHVFEGRGYEVLGAHTLGHNSDVGIALVGNYENDKVTPAQKAAVQALRKKLGVTRGSLVAHCKTYATSCPGKNAREAFGLSC